MGIRERTRRVREDVLSLRHGVGCERSFCSSGTPERLAAPKRYAPSQSNRDATFSAGFLEQIRPEVTDCTLWCEVDGLALCSECDIRCVKQSCRVYISVARFSRRAAKVRRATAKRSLPMP
jgi:hypothetical protein